MYGNFANGTYKGHQIAIDEIDYGDCRKREATVKLPNGTLVYPKLSPYYIDLEDVENWIETELLADEDEDDEPDEANDPNGSEGWRCVR